MTASPATGLSTTAVTRRIVAPAALLAALPAPTGGVCFLRGGDGLVGWGVHARLSVTGPDAALQIQDWFAEVCAGVLVDDDVRRAGSGPVALVSMGFDDADESVAVVPQVLLASGPSGTFVTTIGDGTLHSATAGALATLGQANGDAGGPHFPVRSPGRVRYADASLSVAAFTSAVTSAKARIRVGELAKVVLAHDLAATTARQIDERFLLAQLAAHYPDCWTFAVEGLVGSSPELLIRRSGRAIASRVLAGTAWPEHAGDRVSADLLASGKQIAEHRYAVQSVSDVLWPVATALDVPDDPVALELANLVHLSTDITGELDSDRPLPTALDLAARLHPTAAVGGTPPGAARQLIRELEPLRRGRYAAPVGWMDAAGDGEFAIALRCAQVDGRSVRLMAGCGIVADSDPEVEAREAQVKMIPIRDALEAREGRAVAARPALGDPAVTSPGAASR